MEGFLKLTKALALSVPVVLSVVLFVSTMGLAFSNEPYVPSQVGLQAENDSILQLYQQAFQTEVNQLESKANMLLSIIGIAVTVWVSLNIYNVIERKQVELLSEKAEHLQRKIKELEKLESTLSSELSELKRDLDLSVNNLLENQRILEEGIDSVRPSGYGYD